MGGGCEPRIENTVKMQKKACQVRGSRMVGGCEPRIEVTVKILKRCQVRGSRML